MNSYSPNLKTLNREKRHLAFRIIILVSLTLILMLVPDSISPALPGQFFKRFTLLHLFWGLWMIYMTIKLLPFLKLHNRSENRQFAAFFRPCANMPGKEHIRRLLRKSNLKAIKSAVAWLVLTAFIGIMRRLQVIHERGLVILTGIFYVCDLICVIYYCPFQHLLMKNSCCNSCRIHNWDAIMMFTPMAFVNSFFGISLFAVSALIFILWELRCNLFPERFFPCSNANTRCDACPDHLCKIR